MNVLTLARNAYRYEIDGKPWPDPHFQTDYLVDGDSLGQLFRFESSRPWFGQTCFEDGCDHLNALVLQLCGLTPSQNQFGTDRFVLYRCHCGDDNCGIVSCRVQRHDNVVQWIDIRYENDFGTTYDETSDVCIPVFEFDATEYDDSIKAFLEHLVAGYGKLSFDRESVHRKNS